MIIRENYLNKLRPYYHDKTIKMIMGVRRAGKSTLINQIIDELVNDKIDKDHIHVINFDMFDYTMYTNTALFTNYLRGIIKDNNKYYIFIDEIQNVKGWEKIISLFNTSFNLSIFVTGSNINLNESEYIKYLDNIICINIFPLTYKEVYNIKKGNKNTIFEEYLNYGGMPLTINELDYNVRRTYIMDVYNSIVVKDIVDRYTVKDVALFNKMVNYILLNLPNQFSVNSMTKFFETYDRKVSLDTMYNYLEYISKTGMFSKIERYNVLSNRVIAGKYKFYLSDFNFINLLDMKLDNIRKYKLECIVCNELLYRGYDVKQAIVGSKEIDFIVSKDSNKYYIQVIDSIEDEDIRKEVFRKYKYIKDNYPKYILTMDNKDYSSDGVIHKNIIDFLLEENYLK